MISDESHTTNKHGKFSNYGGWSVGKRPSILREQISYFGQLGDHGKTEMKRHNLAVERLSKAREEYSQDRQQRLDYLNKTIVSKNTLNRPSGTSASAMREYHEVTGQSLPPLAR